MFLLNSSKKIKKREIISFYIEEGGLYFLSISAKVKSENQRGSTDDEELIVKINDKSFPKIGTESALKNSPASFNGGTQHNTEKTIYFILQLQKGEHRIVLEPQHSAEVTKIEYNELLIEGNEISLDLNKQPIVADRKPWVTFVLVDLEIKKMSMEAEVKWRFFDGDDIKVIINGEIQKNPNSIFHKDWIFSARPLIDIFGKTETKSFQITSLGHKSHYIELFADRTPKIKSVVFEVGGVSEKKQDSRKNGKVVLYNDILPTDFANLRSEPFTKDNNIITQLRDGQELVIVDEKVEGDYIESLSSIWHKVQTESVEGYILSTFVEIAGQERSEVVEKIRSKAKELDTDSDLMLALAASESKFKPYAVSGAPAYGIFQLTKISVEQLNELGFKISDPFDIDKNIEGGIRYFYWLLNTFYKDKSDPIKKTIAAYNWGQNMFSPDEEIDKLELPQETVQLIERVLKNWKNRNWFQIITLLILFISLVTISMSVLNIPRYYQTSSSGVLGVNSSADIQVDTRNCPDLIEKENSTLLLLDSNCKFVKSFNSKGLFLTLDSRNAFLVSFHRVIQHNATFYFTAIDSFYCGANNCNFNLYKYNSTDDTVNRIAKIILGTPKDVLLSPNNTHLITHAQFQGSSCNTNSYLNVHDIQSNTTTQILLELSSYESIFVRDIEWLDGNEVKFRAMYTHGCNVTHPDYFNNLDKTLIYNISTKKIQELERKIVKVTPG